MNINLFIRCDLTVLCGVLLLFFVAIGVQSSSHWIVTENGLKINALPDSPYHLKQPHSLVDFLEQDKTIENAFQKEEFMQKLRNTVKKGIYEDDPDLEEKFRKHDSDCRQSADVPFNTENFATSYPVDIYHLMGQTPKISLDFDKADSNFEPICALPQFYDSEQFSQRLPCFERKMVLKPEFELRHLLPQHQKISDLGGALHYAMQEYPKDPLIAYNAMLYWRVRGNAVNAVNCLLRHFYLSQFESSDVRAAEFALGNLLVKLGCYNDSMQYLISTMNKFPDDPNIRSAYADALALSGNHSEAQKIYTEVFRKYPSHVICSLKASALRCHMKLIEALDKQHQNLVQLVELSHRYPDRFEFLETLEAEITAKLASKDKRKQSSFLYDHFVYGPLKQLKCPARQFSCSEAGNALCEKLICNLRDASEYSKDLIRRHMELRAMQAKSDKIEEIAHVPRDWWDEDVPSSSNVQELVAFFKALEPFVDMNIDEPSYPKKYPLENYPEELKSLFPWPNRTFCERPSRRGHKAPSRDFLPQVFLSIDNKGFVTSDFFTKYLRLLSENDVHPLPWNQPTCEDGFKVMNARIPKEAEEGVRIALSTHRKRAQFVEERVKPGFLALSGKEMHLSTGDIGQRIRTIHQMSIAPKWMTSNWAALYWRVNGAPDQAVACLLQALSQEDSRYDDVALVQLAQLVISTAPNHSSDALALLEQALKVERWEPVTHHLIGVIELLRGRPSSAYRRFIDALFIDPNFAPAQDALLTSRCDARKAPVTVRDLYPPQSCSLSEKLVYCTRKKDQRVCFKIEFDEKYKTTFVYFRCNEVYHGRSEAVPGLFRVLSPLMFSIDDKRREDRLLANRKKASSGIEDERTAGGVRGDELPLDYAIKDKSLYFNPHRGEQYPKRPHEVRFNADAYFPSNSTNSTSSEDLKEEWYEEVVLAEPGANKVNFEEINDIRKVLPLDVPMPEFLEEPDEEMVRKGVFYFKPPTANTFHDFCAIYKKGSVFLDQPPSTWVSVTAKGVDYEDHIDFTTPVAGHGQYEPVCPDLDAPSPLESFDHLPPYHVRERLNKFYKPEKALTDALKSMAHEMERIEHVAARLHIAMRVSRLQPLNENQAGGVHWTLSIASTLYWRVRGDAVNAIKCFRHSMNNAPPNMRDVALVSMANIYQNTGFLHSALISASAAFRISPDIQVIHATLANIYAALADYERALKFYYSTLAIQPNFKPAKERIRAIYCQTGMTYNLFPGIKH
ncbi:hypothetical protein L596_028014 [Steinernema carpocapsae]|uniref:Tetratricopeptide repeat protein 17 n=1 Tax=Steinernema carpocapsae TaxID=34508 RepID=A0A4U5LX89_STECR|nr:hypothetical protein L596_028014 [Steinernema carpocapsae]